MLQVNTTIIRVPLSPTQIPPIPSLNQSAHALARRNHAKGQASNRESIYLRPPLLPQSRSIRQRHSNSPLPSKLRIMPCPSSYHLIPQPTQVAQRSPLFSHHRLI